MVSSTQARPLRDGACIVWTREAGTSYLLGHLAAKGVGIVVDDGSELRTAAVLRPRLLYANRYLAQVPRRPKQVFDLIALPIVIFRPPRRWESAEEATAALLDRVVR